jgi:hypothetical protein
MMLRIQPHLVGDYATAMDVEWGRAFAPASRALGDTGSQPAGLHRLPQNDSADIR